MYKLMNERPLNLHGDEPLERDKLALGKSVVQLAEIMDYIFLPFSQILHLFVTQSVISTENIRAGLHIELMLNTHLQKLFNKRYLYSVIMKYLLSPSLQREIINFYPGLERYSFPSHIEVYCPILQESMLCSPGLLKPLLYHSVCVNNLKTMSIDNQYKKIVCHSPHIPLTWVGARIKYLALELIITQHERLLFQPTTVTWANNDRSESPSTYHPQSLFHI